MTKTVKQFFIDTKSLANLGDISSRCIEIRKYIEHYPDHPNDVTLQKIHTKTCEILQLFFNIQCDNNVNRFSKKLSAISEICWSIENITHDILRMMLNHNDDTMVLYEQIEKELIMLLDISEFTKK